MTIRYHVEMADDRGSFRSSSIAETVGGDLVSTVRRFDGTCDLALIDVLEDAVEDLEALLDDDDNVIAYRC